MTSIHTLDEFETEFRKGLGRPLPLAPWRTVTEESIRRFGEGVGDHNPLWRDPEYARRARFGDLTAAPTFLFSVNVSVMASIYGHIPVADISTRDVTLLYLGASIEWHRPMWLGDRIRAVERPVSVERTSTRQIKEALTCTGRSDYWNSRGELVATITNTMLRFQNLGTTIESQSDDGEPYAGVAPDPLVHARKRRGDVPLFFEDVEVGQSIEDLPKGTYTTTELYLFSYVSQEAYRLAQVEEGVLDMGAGGRADPEFARAHRAQEAQFDWGPQRVCWLAQAVTDWMGDWGTIVRLDSRIRRPNLVGDVNTVRGEVVGREQRDGQNLVAIKVEVVNQTGARTADGTATVALPARDSIQAAEWRGETQRGVGAYA